MVLLSFCRGGVGKCNRTNAAWECTTLRELVTLMSFSPVRRGVNKQVLDGVIKDHPFPSVNVPLNCYICFSTLPDSL